MLDLALSCHAGLNSVYLLTNHRGEKNHLIIGREKCYSPPSFVLMLILGPH